MLKVCDLCQGHWRSETELGHGRAALVRARARRGWSEGAGAHRTRVDWEQVEDTPSGHCLVQAGSCLHHTLHYGG